MATESELAALEASLLARDALRQFRAVLELDRLADPPEEMLVRIHTALRPRSWARPHVVSAFERSAAAAADTAAGDEIVLAALHASGPGSDDLIASAVGALAKRWGVGASAELDALLRARGSWGSKHSAVCALAAVGDDRSWEPVFERLLRHLKKAPPEDPPELILQISYLMRHAGSDPARADRVRTALRNAGPALHVERHQAKAVTWLGEVWPGLFVGDPAIPAPDVFERFLDDDPWVKRLRSRG